MVVVCVRSIVLCATLKELRWIYLVIITRNLILLVADVVATAEPLGAISLVAPFRPNAGLHANLIQRRRLG